MEDLIIRKSDIENLGRKLMKEVYKFLHYEYILSYEDMKVEKDKLEKYLVEFYFKVTYNKFLIDIFNHENYKKELKNITEDKIKYEEYLKEIKSKIEDESLDIKLIFEVLDRIKVCSELNGDLYCKKKAFIYIYCVFDHYHRYLTK